MRYSSSSKITKFASKFNTEETLTWSPHTGYAGSMRRFRRTGSHELGRACELACPSKRTDCSRSPTLLAEERPGPCPVFHCEDSVTVTCRGRSKTCSERSQRFAWCGRPASKTFELLGSFRARSASASITILLLLLLILFAHIRLFSFWLQVCLINSVFSNVERYMTYFSRWLGTVAIKRSDRSF